MSDNSQRALGAMPPPSMQWMMGKTVREIQAIRAESEATGKTLAEVAAGEDWKKRLPAPYIEEES